MIELRGISKYFSSNGVMALKNADLTLCAGEIHALLGENGSGKSTLMHVLAGYFSPSSGSVLVDKKGERFLSTADALKRGIAMVRQHPAFIKGFKVWEDCILGAEGQHVFLNLRLLKKRVEELSMRWGFDLPLAAASGSLTVNQRFKAAVLSLLLRNVNWFIFDEPTAVLTAEETKSFYELLRRLRSENKGIILITHKLEEALEVSDRVTIMAQGVTGQSRKTKEITLPELQNQLFEITSEDLSQPRTGDRRRGAKEPKVEKERFPVRDPHFVLEIKNLELRLPGLPHIRNANFTLTNGKILGVAGVRDSGFETLEQAIVGLLDFSPQKADECKGSITLNGKDITGKGVCAFRESGGAYLGSDRLSGSFAPDLPLSESLIIHVFKKARRGVFLKAAALNSWCGKIMSRAGIERSVSDRADSFSGGMIQRVLLAREFAEAPLLLVLAEAGSSLDRANLLKLVEELKNLAARGSAVLLFSTDLNELRIMADEIFVLRNGEINEI